MSPEEARGYFEFLANLGLTKHLGSMEATRKLIDLCHIDSEKYVLDVGCGVGATPRYLAEKVGCRVVGVDLLEKMTAQSRERAQAAGIAGRATFAVADACKLPFEDGRFDAVVAESVNVFFEDKQEAMREYARVTKPGGYVGITEMTWLRPVAQEVKAYYKRVVHADALEVQGWMALLKEAGLQDVSGDAHQVEIPQEGKGRFERYGCRGIVKVMLKTLVAVFQDRASREFLKDVTGSLPKDLLGDMGYGVYAGKKK
jgi:ubiquinone/menaquinone biosynthesis C-methylase UbiE